MTRAQSRTPSAKRRRAVLSAYRARQKRNANLWLVYSVKTDRDWLLQSDRELVHWIVFLETDPRVATFDLAPEPILSYDASETRATEPDALVQTVDGHTELHEVKAGRVIEDSARSQLLAQSAGAQARGAAYRVFCDTQLAPHRKTAVRWLKAIAYAAPLRDQTHASCRDALLAHLRGSRQGSVRSVLGALPQFDAPLVLGLLVRQVIHGHLQLDLNRRSFGYATCWAWCHGH
jgi:hypothetical protein